jgi:hypothetical protein
MGLMGTIKKIQEICISILENEVAIKNTADR